MNILDHKTVTTRVEHHCWGCARKFPVGSKMETVTSVDNGQITKVYWCDDCHNFLQSLPSWETMDGFGYGDLLNYEEYKAKLMQVKS
jgi:hypothetical protein